MTTRRLLDDREVTVRPISTADDDTLVRFHDALSSESQHMRFFAVHPHLTDAEVRRFTTVDHRGREALVAAVGHEIFGVRRYDRLADRTHADVAFVTRDDHRGLGVATILFDELVRAAQAVGITHVIAETLPENHKMLHLFNHTGLASGLSFGRNCVEATPPTACWTALSRPRAPTMSLSRTTHNPESPNDGGNESHRLSLRHWIIWHRAECAVRRTGPNVTSRHEQTPPGLQRPRRQVVAGSSLGAG